MKQSKLIVLLLLFLTGICYAIYNQQTGKQQIDNGHGSRLVDKGDFIPPSCPIEDYRDMLNYFWGKLYKDGGETLYCQYPFKNKGKNMNVEHVMPVSWMTRELRCGSRQQCERNDRSFRQMQTDLHNIYPANRDVNKVRGHYAFADIPGNKREFSNCDFEVDRKKRQVEPPDEYKGNIARAMLYMEQVYAIPIYSKQKSKLLKWHFSDPPDEAEKKRNDIIEKIQGNRNPLIDHPEIAKNIH